MKTSTLFTSAFCVALVHAGTVELPRSIGDLCKAPEGDGICESVSACDGIEQPDANCAKGGDAECCVSMACNTSGGEEGLCRRTDQGCDGGEFIQDDECPGSTQCCVQKSEDNDLEARSICSKPKKNDCKFYRQCLEKKMKCGKDGYPLGYGEKYCHKFSKARPELSAKGKAWVTKTMLCLQKELVPWATGEKKGSCSELKSQAFASHPGCYIKGGVCTLGPKDWAVIVDTVGFLELFNSKDALLATLKTVGGCGEFYWWLFKRGLESLWPF